MKALRALVVGVVVLATVLFAYGLHRFYAPLALPHEKIELYLPRGQGAQAAELLHAQGVLSPLDRLIVAIASRLGPSLKAGEYAFTAPTSAADILRTLRSGRGIHRKITFPEGISAAEAVALLRDNPYLTGDVDIPDEGALLPETYVFDRGDARNDVLKRAIAAQQTLLQQLWRTRTPNLPLRTPAEAVILASIVEKETGRADERPRIAAVFRNRLLRGMRLQSDPTAVYGITGGAAPLGRVPSAADMRHQSQYNTYVINGLPPTPIACPGRAALEAVLHPADDRESLYFVADGTGGHVFSADYATHQRHINRLRGRAF